MRPELMASEFSREAMVQLGRHWQRAGSAAANAKRLGCDSDLPKHHLPIATAIDGKGLHGEVCRDLSPLEFIHSIALPEW